MRVWGSSNPKPPKNFPNAAARQISLRASNVTSRAPPKRVETNLPDSRLSFRIAFSTRLDGTRLRQLRLHPLSNPRVSGLFRRNRAKRRGTATRGTRVVTTKRRNRSSLTRPNMSFNGAATLPLPASPPRTPSLHRRQNSDSAAFLAPALSIKGERERGRVEIGA
jgi:hypothetical protein